jgi:DNA-binding LacI/PurR family transcriptional regulator
MPQIPVRLIYVNDRFDTKAVTISQGAYFLQRFEALSSVARKKGMILAIRDIHATVSQVAAEKIDGLIMTIFGHGARAHRDQLAYESLTARFPSVYWGSRPPARPVDYVGPDERMGISETLNRLWSLGYRRFGWFGALDERFTQERFSAFLSWHQRQRLPLRPEWTYPYDMETGRFMESARLKRMPTVSNDRYYLRQVQAHGASWISLPESERPEIILCDTDSTARHLIRTWGREPGKGMPGIVGYDDSPLPMEPWGYNYLSTVRYDFASQASAVISLLERRWKQPAAPAGERLVPSRCVIRMSSLPPVPGRGHAAGVAILEFLKENYRDPDVSTLATRKFGLSIAALQRRLSRFAGTGWQRFLEQCRIESAARDLGETKRTVTEIYLDNGYRHHGNFALAFRRRYGTTPEAYRKGKMPGKAEDQKKHGNPGTHASKR